MTEFDKDQFENTELENEKFESIEASSTMKQASCSLFGANEKRDS